MNPNVRFWLGIAAMFSGMFLVPYGSWVLEIPRLVMALLMIACLVGGGMLIFNGYRWPWRIAR